MKARRIRILLAEDHPLARTGVRTLLNAQSDMKVVAEACNGCEAVALFRKHLPDVMLIDLLMPQMGGAEAATEIHAQYPDAKMIGLSTYAREYDVKRALAAGMQGYLTKDAALEELVTAVRVVHSGGTYLPPALAEVAAESDKPDLSSREFQVLNLIAHGYSNKQIAYELQIAEHTIKNHVSNILIKLGVQDRTEAVSMAIQRGIIHL